MERVISEDAQRGLGLTEAEILELKLKLQVALMKEAGCQCGDGSEEKWVEKYGEAVDRIVENINLTTEQSARALRLLQVLSDKISANLLADFVNLLDELVASKKQKEV